MKEMKQVSYKGVRIFLPPNVSMKIFKQVVDILGKQYSEVQQIINLISKKLPT